MPEESKSNIPQEFVCALTNEIMKEPMVSRYGTHFEHDAIMDWLKKGNNYCPATGKRTLNFALSKASDINREFFDADSLVYVRKLFAHKIF
jgi:hypothetical protein